MKCYHHPLKDAVASCSSCGRFICEQCQQSLQIKLLCPACYQELAGQTPAKYQPISDGIKFLLYTVSFMAMPLGLILGAIFYTRPDERYHRVGRNCIVLALVPFIFFCVCSLAYFFFAFGGILGSGVLDKAIHIPVY